LYAVLEMIDNRYSYKALSIGRCKIRLLTILPGTCGSAPQIRFTLLVWMIGQSQKLYCRPESTCTVILQPHDSVNLRMKRRCLSLVLMLISLKH
jgi:hypothetical protein